MDFYYNLQSKGLLQSKDIAPNVEPFGFYVEAFNELSSCRPSGFGVGPIPFTAIVEYAKIYDVGDFHEFLDIIRTMDAKFMEIESKKSKSNVNTNKTHQNNGRRKG